MEGGPCAQRHHHYEKIYCLIEGSYAFTIYDEMGDGMTNCFDDYTCGYSIQLNGQYIIEGDRDYNETKKHDFIVASPAHVTKKSSKFNEKGHKHKNMLYTKERSGVRN